MMTATGKPENEMSVKLRLAVGTEYRLSTDLFANDWSPAAVWCQLCGYT